MMALGIVASFRINRVVNLGIPGLAVFGATLYFQMSHVGGAPVLVSLLGGGLVGAAFGALLGSCNLKLTRWPRGIVTICTLPATLGIPLGYFVGGVWAVAGALAALAGILVSPRTTLDPYLILFVTIWALAGSILGGLESFGVAFVGSILVGLSQGILGGGIIHL